MAKKKDLPTGVTEAMHSAIHWLHEHGNEGAYVRRKKPTMNGSETAVLANGEQAPFEAVTWGKLLERMYLRHQAGRVYITHKGHRLIVDHPKVKPFVYAEAINGRVEPHPGAE